MSVLYYDKHSSSHFIGIGDTLYQYSNQQITSRVQCGAVPQSTELRAEGVSFVTSLATNKDCLVVISNNKVVEVFDRKLEKKAATIAPKRPTSVKLTNSHVILADKSGDAYQYDLGLANQKYLLGHVSVVMDTALTRDEKLLITCDRDEKIRVSHYPNCYNIHSYLLGHTEYVHRIILLSDSLLVSFSGDNKIMLWDILTGQQLQTHDSTSDVISAAWAAPYLISSTSTTISTFRLSDKNLQPPSELKLEHEIVSLSVGNSTVVVLTKQPSLEEFKISESGSLEDRCKVECDIDLSSVSKCELPEKNKVLRTAGFTDYFERKRKRIEEETLKEEARSMKIAS